MPRSSRRKFLTRTGAGIAGVALWPSLPASMRANTGASTIPPHKEQLVPGVHGYAPESVAAGQGISFHVSSTIPYRFSICRLGARLDDPSGDDVLFDFPEADPTPQPIHPGSYVHVEKRLTQPLRALTLECWVRPWKTNRWAGLITQYDYKSACGFGLFLNSNGSVAFYLGDGQQFRPECLHVTPRHLLKAQQWHHIAATWDGSGKAIWIDGQRAGQWDFRGDAAPGDAPLRLAAYGENDLADHFLDGDLAMPVIYNRALSPAEITTRFEQKGASPPKGSHILACWPFSEEKGGRVADVSSHRREGRIINHATWMIGGPAFQAEAPRFGNYDPKRDARRGHGLRFASDDLYDCRWRETHAFNIPADARPGLYAARLHFESDGQPHLYHITFVVRKPTRRKKAPILLLCASNTWRAYNATPFAKNSPELKRVSTTAGMPNSPGDPPAFSFYRKHAAGQGSYQLGLKMPFVAADPYLLYGKATEYSHLARADRCTQVWLERNGYDYDIIADQDLHRDPDLLRGYHAFIINGHSEYWSLPMYRGLEQFLQSGGNVACLSGNSLFWRVSFNEDCSILECRKVDAPGDQVPAARRGEAWHSHDGLRGGLLRECGFPGWKLIGLETLGWTGTLDADRFGPFIAEETDHPFFNHPEKVGLKPGDKFGHGPNGSVPLANGHEIDVRLSTLAALQQQPDPEGASLPADPPNIIRIANGIIPWHVGGSAFDYFFRPIKPATPQGAEMIYWERPDGGKVFNAGSIGIGWTLLADEKLSALLRNVLFHFGVKP